MPKTLRGKTPLDLVSAPWNQPMAGIYRYVAGLLQIKLDLERITVARPQVADILRKSGGKISAIAIWDFVNANFWAATRGVAAGFKHAGDVFCQTKRCRTMGWTKAAAAPASVFY